MALSDQINADLKLAMLARDEVRLRTLRAVKSAILIAGTEKGAATVLSTEDEIKLLQKLVKQRKEAAEIYGQQGRKDLEESELAEVTVLEIYLPKQMSQDEITSAIKEIIISVGATSPADMGKVMGAVSKALSGKADNRLVSQIVKELLSN